MKERRSHAINHASFRKHDPCFPRTNKYFIYENLFLEIRTSSLYHLHISKQQKSYLSISRQDLTETSA